MSKSKERRSKDKERDVLPDATEPAEDRLLHLEPDDVDVEKDLATEELFDTQHGEGHTYNVRNAMQQDLTYTPPTDPPIVASEDRLEGVEIAAGFAPSMEDSQPARRVLPEHLATSDLEVQDRVYEALLYNSETRHLTDIAVQVADGVVHLLGTVPDDGDLAQAYNVVSGLAGVVRVESHLLVKN